MKQFVLMIQQFESDKTLTSLIEVLHRTLDTSHNSIFC
jgi:hypothetical protein